MMAPENIHELAEAVRSSPRVLAVGAGTKPRLSQVDAARISMQRLCGIIEYDPSEFTFTALAGTPLKEIAAALAEKHQYLPFDPPLIEAGATLGGTVAAGLSGPGRFRYGGVRDFILGIRYIDGVGRALRMGGKVVKNAAGFDLPKFFVGSLGRFGVLAELTFKVFPRPASSMTLRLHSADIRSAAPMLQSISRGRWEVEALDLLPGSHDIALRIAGPENALPQLARDLLSRFDGAILSGEEAAILWKNLSEFRWVPPDRALLKVPITPDRIAALLEGNASDSIHVSAGGNVAWLATRQMPACPAMTLWGDLPLWTSATPRPAIWQSIKTAMDPEGRFPTLDP